MKTLATIFDFDGIIADTEYLHYLAMNEILEPLGCGFSWETYQTDYIGFDDRDAFREAHKTAGTLLLDEALPRLVDHKAIAFLRIIEEEDVPSIPGAVDTIRAAAEKGPVALCTGALLSDVEPLLAKFSIRECFDAIVTAEQVAHSKPDPESYRLAAERLGVPPEQCLAIEDTPTGLTSAREAGCRTLGVTTTHTEAQLLAFADRVVSALEPSVLESGS